MVLVQASFLASRYEAVRALPRVGRRSPPRISLCLARVRLADSLWSTAGSRGRTLDQAGFEPGRREANIYRR